MPTANFEMKGVIVRIALENFVTYTSVEFRPGENLNVIIGPNGTGKSSILCAIVLGLGGKPKVVARGATVAAYVKEGCQSAKIEIELSNPGGNNYVVTRKFDLNNKTIWSINGKTKSTKDVEALMKELHIQVDNLCQFLPQDRVQDFAKMNNESLLENTEKSVGSEEMYEQHVALKKLREEQTDMEKAINSVMKNAEKEQQLNEGNAVQVQNLHQKKKLSAQLTTLKQRLAWILYQAHATKKEEMIRNREEAVEELTQCEAQYRPLKATIAEINAQIAAYEKNTRKLRTDADIKESKLKICIRSLEKLDNSLTIMASDLEAEEAAEESRAKDIEKFTQMIETLQNDLRSCQNRSETEVQAEIRDLQPQIHRSSGMIQKLQVCFNQTTVAVDSLTHDIGVVEADKRRLENQLNNRLNILRQRNPDVHTAVMWLRENKHRFRRNVYEPMLLEINVKDPRYASYIESAIPFRDMIAFTCEDEEDMSDLVRELRTNQRLSDINVVHSTDRDRYEPPHKIEDLRNYGFITYLREQMTAPKPIVNYLCKFAKIHRVPVGRKVNTDNVPRDVNQFYSEKFKFINSYSTYTNELTTRTSEVSDATFFTSSVDSGAMKTLVDRLTQLNIEAVEKKNTLQQVREKIELEESEIDRLRMRKRQLQDENEQKKTIQAKINMRVQQRQAVINSCVDIEELRRNYKRSRRELFKKSVTENEITLCAFKELKQALTAVVLASEGSSSLKQQRAIAENSASELKTKTRQAEENLTKCEQRILAIREEQLVLKKNAQALTDGKSPWETAFKEAYPNFNILPTDIQELEDSIGEKEGRLTCLGADNNALLAEYEARQERIALLTADVETRQNNAVAKQAEIDRLQALWLPSVQQLVDRINENFARSFGELGCSGEVTLTKGENPNDYHLYGISIRVTYRDSETLQQLNQYLQSGGERAVATAIYLISLQELTSSPFRCVDEINQGMDPINERQIFELLVKTTSQPGTAQYFLLTPKLLPNLTYMDTVNVLVVNNGKHSSISYDYERYALIIRGNFERAINKPKSDSGR